MLDRYERSCYLFRMKKGDDTKQMILEKALDMASQVGLECVTIGNLAKEISMSKSGLFAHFRSKENLQLEILKFAGSRFSDGVVVPALKCQAGIPRIKALLENWVKWGAKLTGGCIFIAAASDFSDRPGNVRDLLLHQQQEWVDTLRRIAQSAIKSGEFREDTDCEQFAFDLYSLILGFHLFHKLLRDSETRRYQEIALERLLAHYKK